MWAQAVIAMAETTADDLIQRGDVFANEWSEYEVLRVYDDGTVKVRNLAGMEERKDARELIELVTGGDK